MISFSSLIPGFELQDSCHLRRWLSRVIFSENKQEGEINYIFCDDEYLLSINQNFLSHDTLTDIITFPTSRISDIISGEIYISIERVIENSVLTHHEFTNELSRVLVHGVLHLAGYNDATVTEKSIMRAKEDYYLNLQT